MHKSDTVTVRFTGGTVNAVVFDVKLGFSVSRSGRAYSTVKALIGGRGTYPAALRRFRKTTLRFCGYDPRQYNKLLIQRRYPVRSAAGFFIDTGATDCCVSENLAKSFNLIEFRTADISTAGGDFIVPTYNIDLLLSDTLIFKNIEVAEFIGKPDFDFIIGMNILRQGDMAISNAAGETVFSFRVPPDIRHIDFCPKSPDAADCKQVISAP